MERFNRVLTGVENVLAAGALGLAALIAIVNITIRQFGAAFFWSEEAIIYLVIYSTFLGAVVTLRHDEHVSVNILSLFLGKGGKKALALLAGLTSLVYLAIMGWLGWLLVNEPFSRTTITPAMKLPLWAVELAVPLGMTLMFLRAIEMLWRTWRHGPASEDVDEILASEAEATGLSLEEIAASRAAIAGGVGEPVAEEPGRDSHHLDEHRDDRHDERPGRSGRRNGQEEQQ